MPGASGLSLYHLFVDSALLIELPLGSKDVSEMGDRICFFGMSAEPRSENVDLIIELPGQAQ